MFCKDDHNVDVTDKRFLDGCSFIEVEYKYSRRDNLYVSVELGIISSPMQWATPHGDCYQKYNTESFQFNDVEQLDKFIVALQKARDEVFGK